LCKFKDNCIFKFRISDQTVIKKKQYSKPEINWIEIDKSISIIMQSVPPHDPDPRAGSKKGGSSEPFASPFGDKPFG
jgi:hypothetical protein